VEEVAAVVKDSGATVEITKDSGGDPMIKASFGKSNFRVLFYGCSPAKRCKSIQFSSAWDLKDGMTAAKANEWNFTKRWGRLGLDDENDPFLNMDLYLEDGATTEALASDMVIWYATMLSFMEFASK
jgi:hypothetical protein